MPHRLKINQVAGLRRRRLAGPGRAVGSDMAPADLAQRRHNVQIPGFAGTVDPAAIPSPGRSEAWATPIRPSRKWAGQRLWPGVHVGSSFGMYPAIEIHLRLDRICAAQRRSAAALETAFRARNVRYQPAPSTPYWRREPAAVKRSPETAGGGRRRTPDTLGRAYYRRRLAEDKPTMEAVEEG
jgi:hypothetical protein